MSLKPFFFLLLNISAGATLVSAQDLSKFSTTKLGPWTIHMEKVLEADSVRASEIMDLIHVQIYQIIHSVPTAAVEKLETIPIWVEMNDTDYQGRASYINH